MENNSFTLLDDLIQNDGKLRLIHLNLIFVESSENICMLMIKNVVQNVKNQDLKINSWKGKFSCTICEIEENVIKTGERGHKMSFAGECNYLRSKNEYTHNLLVYSM